MQTQLPPGAQLLQTPDGQTFLYNPMGMDGSQTTAGNILGLNNSILASTSGNAQVAGTGNAITMPQTLTLSNNFVRESLGPVKRFGERGNRY